MLRATFKHLRASIRETERHVWARGITNLNEYVAQSEQLELFPNSSGLSQDPQVSATLEAIENKDVDFFSQQLNPEDWFRIVLEFPKDTLFLDLETTGLA